MREWVTGVGRGRLVVEPAAVLAACADEDLDASVRRGAVVLKVERVGGLGQQACRGGRGAGGGVGERGEQRERRTRAEEVGVGFGGLGSVNVGLGRSLSVLRLRLTNDWSVVHTGGPYVAAAAAAAGTGRAASGLPVLRWIQRWRVVMSTPSLMAMWPSVLGPASRLSWSMRSAVEPWIMPCACAGASLERSRLRPPSEVTDSAPRDIMLRPESEAPRARPREPRRTRRDDEVCG